MNAIDEHKVLDLQNLHLCTALKKLPKSLQDLSALKREKNWNDRKATTFRDSPSILLEQLLEVLCVLLNRSPGQLTLDADRAGTLKDIFDKLHGYLRRRDDGPASLRNLVGDHLVTCVRFWNAQLQ